MKPYEWTDKISAMQDALRALNLILLESGGLEATARDEAFAVKSLLDAGDWTEAELIDRLKQAAVDLLTHKRAYQ